ncbi:uncharacterized protein LOC141913037 [Tubulanus polymorphus]|uniref:uncharacterized protein LOC141913037 n=1 Tax=Tubulanus polymorphus TaxID=672921 RepID=UPI003DA4B52A
MADRGKTMKAMNLDKKGAKNDYLDRKRIKSRRTKTQRNKTYARRVSQKPVDSELNKSSVDLIRTITHSRITILLACRPHLLVYLQVFTVKRTLPAADSVKQGTDRGHGFCNLQWNFVSTIPMNMMQSPEVADDEESLPSV